MIFDALFGNANIEKILLFLFVNEKCYATQLSDCLNGSLTPIQHALQRLENGGIIHSHFEGKTRLFRFNPHYPFLKELQQLLKQGFQHLNLHDQKKYYCPSGKGEKNKKRYNEPFSPSSYLAGSEPLLGLWERLVQVQHLSFSAQSKADKPSGWNGIGRAKVEVQHPSPYVLIFQEQGSWTSQEGKQFDFKNSFRWTCHPKKSLLTLEHLRQGHENPVLLFELAPIHSNRFETRHPYLCKQDTYLAHLDYDHHFIQLNWRVLGPKKNEDIQYIYT